MGPKPAPTWGHDRYGEPAAKSCCRAYDMAIDGKRAGSLDVGGSNLGPLKQLLYGTLALPITHFHHVRDYIVVTHWLNDTWILHLLESPAGLRVPGYLRPVTSLRTLTTWHCPHNVSAAAAAKRRSCSSRSISPAHRAHSSKHAAAGLHCR